MIFGDRKIMYHLKVTQRALTMHWRVILIVLLLRRSMKAKMYRSQCKRDNPHIVAITVWCYSIYMNHSAQHC